MPETKTGGKLRLLLTCHFSTVIYKTRAKALEKNFLPFIIIEESYLQTFSHSLTNALFSGFVGIILIFFIPYTASGFKAVGTLFNSLFGFDYHVSMIAGAAIIIGYTVLGGFLAVSTTDLIQSVVYEHCTYYSSSSSASM